MLQIYVPQGQTRPTLLAELGLAELCADGDRGSVTTILADGPDGDAGLLIEFGRPTGQWKDHVWSACWPDPKRNLPAGRFWWGFPKDGLEPDHLAYVKQFKGDARFLGDGNAWVFPNMMALPHRFTGDPQTGEEIREVHPDWDTLYRRLVWAYDWCVRAVNEGMSVLPDVECREYLAEVLAVNYRMNRELALRLKLFDGTWWNLMAATTDIDRLVKLQAELSQKKVAGTQPG